MAENPRLWLPGSVQKDLDGEVHRALSLGREGVAADPAVQEMRINRTANNARAGGGSLTLSQARPRDPMFYWERNNLPYKVDDEAELQKIRKYLRLIYLTHPLMASAIDIYSKYPLTGMELNCKDPALTDFYSDLFLDQLDYEEFLVLVLREYWNVGEAWPFGSWNETLGIWEDDELLNPDDVRVTKSAFQREPRFEMKLPETLRTILQNKQPVWEYEALLRSYPELQHYLGENAYMPVSNVLLQQLAFKAHTFHPRGIPILLRAMRSLTQEEMLNAAMDAVAERLSTPLILAKLGASATDLGTNTAWVPTEGDLQAFESSLDDALAADFRVLTHHFAVDMSTVFGKEVMPDFQTDFDRLAERQLQVFGMSKTMLSGAQGGETYAADAINRDLVSQLLNGAQRLIRRFVRQRMLVVAEAQEHFDYEVRGGKRYPIMEEVLEVDPRTGEQRIVEQPKLLVPELRIKAMDIRRESEFRDFVESAVAAGVPISQRTRFVNIPVDLEEERDLVVAEAVANAVAAQETRKKVYEALKAQRLPIPEDLDKDFGPKATPDPATADTTTVTPHEPEGPIDSLDPSPANPALMPTEQDMKEREQENGGDGKLPRNLITEEGRTRPPESDEMRKHMPVAAARRGWGTVEPMIFTAAAEGEQSEPVQDDYGQPIIGKLTHGPSHVGMRRFSVVKKDVPLDPPGTDVPPPETPTEGVE